jgi:Zinc knuckle
MNHGEKIVDYGRRAVKTSDQLAITGIPEKEHPKPKQQSMRFIDGLDSSMPVYHGYELYLINAKQQTGTDIYPDTLVEAIKRSTLFEASWTTTTEPSRLTSLPLNAFGAQGAHDDKHPKGGKTPAKGKGEKGKYPSAKDKKEGTDKIGVESKFEGVCFNCGKYGHREAECRSKAMAESTPLWRTPP